MQTEMITNFYHSTVDIVQCSNGRTLMRFVEQLTWDVTWYANTGQNCAWERIDLSQEQYQALNRDLMAAKGQTDFEDFVFEEPNNE